MLETIEKIKKMFAALYAPHTDFVIKEYPMTQPIVWQVTISNKAEPFSRNAPLLLEALNKAEEDLYRLVLLKNEEYAIKLEKLKEIVENGVK